MSEDNREKILQQNMLNLFKYIEEVESRLRVIEEEYMRYDFGYDPVETLQRRFAEKAGFDIWKVKFAMDKPDKPTEPLTPEETRKQWLIDKDGKYSYTFTLDEDNKFTQHPEVVSIRTNKQIAKDDKSFEPTQL